MSLRQTKRKNRTRPEMLPKSRLRKTTILNLRSVAVNVPICLIWPSMRPNKVIMMRLWML